MSSRLSLGCVREEFPALARRLGGESVVYFDGPGGSQVPRVVPEAMSDYILHHNANHGGCFATGRETVEMVADVRELVGLFLNCESSEVTFGQNMTSLTFAFSRALSQTWAEGDNIIVSQLDHDANISTWRRAAEDRGVSVRILPFDPVTQSIPVETLERFIDERTRLVAITSSSNLLGSHVDIAGMSEVAHRFGAYIYVDAVHHAPHYRVDVAALGCDFLVCSAYKFFGPHIGILYGRKDLMRLIEPYKIEPSPVEIPHCWETGTQNFTAVAGLGACLGYLLSLGGEGNGDFGLSYGRIGEMERLLVERFLARLDGHNFLRLHGVSGVSGRAPTFALTSVRHTPEDLARHLADHGVFGWNGHMYAVNLVDALGLDRSDGVLRLGMLHYNSVDEIDYAFDVLDGL